MKTSDRKPSRPSRFTYAPPLKGKWVGKERIKGAGKWQSKRAHIDPPYKGAPSWQCSVYYWWWEYLRCHEGYRETCEKLGQGKYARLYGDFGDVHGDEFWDWWRANGVRLFAEPPPELVTELTAATYVRKRTDVVAVTIPLDLPMRIVSGQIKRMIATRQAERRAERVAQGTVSQALYPVASRPSLPALHMNLKAWKARRDNPGMKLYQIGALLDGVTDSAELSDAANRIDWTNEVARRIRKAKELIGNVGLGLFPLIGEPRTRTKE